MSIFRLLYTKGANDSLSFMHRKQHFARIEQQQLNTMLAHHYGYYLLLIGTDNLDLVKQCQIHHHFLMQDAQHITEAKLKKSHADAIASWYHLPFAPQSVDVVVLHHVLEFCASPHAVLKEAQKILRPDGTLIISGYNPWRPFGYKLWRQKKKTHPDKRHAQMVSPLSLNYYLKQTALEVLNTHYYGVKLRQRGKPHKDRFIDRLLLRFLPIFCSGYMIEAINRTTPLTGLPTTWKPYRMGAKKPITATPCQHRKRSVMKTTES